MRSAIRLVTTVVCAAVFATAAPTYTNIYSGNNQPAFAGFDQMLADLDALDPAFNPAFLTELTRFNAPFVSGAVQSSVTVTRDAGGYVGTWSSTGPIALVIVKAADEFKALYYGIPGSFGDVWSTAGLINNGGQQPDVSHLSFYTHPGLPDDTAVPEPSSWALMVSGGLALFIARRKR